MQMSWFYLVVILLSIAHTGITIFLSKYAKKNRILMYIPSIVTFITTLIFLIKAHYFSEGFDALGYFIFAMISGMLFLCSFLPAMFIEFLNSRKKL